jgi:hypothetical protein
LTRSGHPPLPQLHPLLSPLSWPISRVSWLLLSPVLFVVLVRTRKRERRGRYRCVGGGARVEQSRVERSRPKQTKENMS